MSSFGKTASAASNPKKAKYWYTQPDEPGMVTRLKEPFSLQAITEHIGARHNLDRSPIVDIDHLTLFIHKYLKRNVRSDALFQKKGKGASGTLNLSASGQKTKKPGKAKKPEKESASSAKKPKNATKRAPKPKAKSPKKPAAAKKPAVRKPTKPSKSKAQEVRKLKTPEMAAPKKAKS